MTYRLEGIDTLNQHYNSLIGSARIALQYALFRTGPMAMGPSPLGMFVRSEQRPRSRQHRASPSLPFSRKSRAA